ncbi:DUF2062 domain-containing protein [bacterium]|nr:DUF2062 domain-containing protein [bacterium]
MLLKRKKKLTFWEKTKNFIYPKKGLIRAYKYIFKRVSRIPDKSHAIAIGVACGVGVSMTPFVGFQLLLTALCAFILRGNIIAGLFATAIGNPITFPFIWIGSYKLGNLIIGQSALSEGKIHFIELFKDMKEAIVMLDFNLLIENVLPILIPMAIGGTIMAIISGFITYYLIIGMIDEYKRTHQKKIETAKAKRTQK